MFYNGRSSISQFKFQWYQQLKNTISNVDSSWPYKSHWLDKISNNHFYTTEDYRREKERNSSIDNIEKRIYECIKNIHVTEKSNYTTQYPKIQNAIETLNREVAQFNEQQLKKRVHLEAISLRR